MASEIVAWLGDEEEGSADGMILISHVGEMIVEDPDLRKIMVEGTRIGLKTYKDIANSALGQSLTSTIKTNPSTWHSICTITNRSYWRRAWVMQETALTDNLRISCGHHSMGWSSFRNAMVFILEVVYQIILQSPGHITERSDEGFLIVRNAREELQSGEVRTLSQTILTFRPCLSTDPRDKVFAFLGLQNSVKFPANYLQSVQTVYREAAKALIQEKMSLDILTACNMKHKIPNLPSWVPDWSVNDIGRRHILRHEAFTAGPSKFATYASSGAATPTIQFSEDLDKLTVAGIFLDCIAEVSDSGDNDGFFDSALALWKNFTATIPQEIDAEKRELKTRYANNFWRTLIMDRRLGSRVQDSEAENYKTQFEVRFGIKPLSAIVPASNPKTPDLQRHLGFCSDYILFMDVVKEGRRLAVTEKEYFALVPADAQVGDQICVFLGAQIPFVLRVTEEEFQLVGDCFAQGFMDGEIMDEVKEGRSEVRDFVLI